MTSWQPLLTGPLAERARQAIDEIAAVLAPAATTAAAAAAESPPAATAADLLPGPSLAGGAAGAALFFAYRSRSGVADGGAADPVNTEDAEIAAAFLDQSTEALATTPLAPDLYGGFAGVAWTAEHLYGPQFAEPHQEAPESSETPETQEDPGEDPLAEIDEALIRYLDHSPWTADYDLIRGLVGLGVYALERLPRPSALACLTGVVDRLAETAEHGAQGTTWHTSPRLLPDWQRAIYPEGYYNLGVAHGVPAAVALLGAIAAAGERLAAAGDPAAGELGRRARSLEEGALRWLLAQRLPAGSSSWFASSIWPGTPHQGSRLAWCYGDPGIAATLLLTARSHGPGDDGGVAALAVELAVEAAARPAESSGVRDAGLCHGSAGLAHLFNRIHQQTGEPRLAAASRRWFEHALDFRQPGLGLAGYRSHWIEEDGVSQSWRDSAGMLEGVAGIGLALLAGISSFEPAWDRTMMLSAAGVPPISPEPPPGT
jgi:hypothetical protein